MSVAASGAWQEAMAYRLMDPLFQSAAQGALPQLHAATSPTAKGGEHYGPGQFGGMRGAPSNNRSHPVHALPRIANACGKSAKR